MKYKILTNSDDVYELADRSGRTVKALRLLQVRSTYYTVQNRYAIAKEQCLNDWIEKEEVIEDTISFEMADTDLSVDNFRDEVAKLLFPSAEIAKNIDFIDYGEVEEGLDAFLNFIEPRHKKQNALSTFLNASQAALIENTSQGTARDGQ